MCENLRKIAELNSRIGQMEKKKSKIFLADRKKFFDPTENTVFLDGRRLASGDFLFVIR